MLNEIELKNLNERIHSGDRAGALRSVAVHMVLHLGRTHRDTAGMLMVDESTVSAWVGAYRLAGAAGLDDSPRSGRPPHIPRESIEGMLENVKSITAVDFVTMLNDQFGVRYDISYARRLLRAMGFTLKKRSVISAGTPSQDMVEEWQKDTRKEVEKYEKAGYAVVTIDESHQKTSMFGTGRVYTRGEPEVITAPVAVEKMSVFGGLSLDGEPFFMEAEKANSGTFVLCLKELEKKWKKVFLILDNARYHNSQTVRDYVESRNGNVVLCFLPPYSPFLNPAEALWKYGKGIIRRMLHPPPGGAMQCIMDVYNAYVCGFDPRNILFRNVGRLYPA